MAKISLLIVVIASLCHVTGSEHLELPYCKNALKTTFKKGSSVLVSTLDGRLSSLNAKDGGLEWSIPTERGPLLSSSISQMHVSNGGRNVCLVPSLDGDLYTFDGNRIDTIPLKGETLLSTSFKMADDTVITGGKESCTYGIEVLTGKVRYICSIEGCKNVNSGNREMNEPILVIKRHSQTIRAISPITGNERWNFSVGQHEIIYYGSEGPNGCYNKINDEEEYLDDDEEEEKNNINSSENSSDQIDIRFVVPEGLVIRLGNTELSNAMWEYKFNSPIVKSWLMQDGFLEPLDLFENRLMPVRDHTLDSESVLKPALYLGNYKEQLYVQSSFSLQDHILHGIKTLIVDKQTSFPLVEWKPYLVSAHSRTPLLLGYQPKSIPILSAKMYSREHNTNIVLRSEDINYPFDGGFYIMTLFNHKIKLNNDSSNAETSFNEIYLSLWHYWKEILGISAVLAILINVLIVKFVLRKWQQKFIRENSQEQCKSPTSSSGNLFEQPKNNESPVLVESSSNSSGFGDVPNTPSAFVSRYLTDFEPVQRLGKGGFGVVVQARNKIDDCQYAIKRICLPNKEEARKKVMREVKALAKLDNQGIVRYYNAWVEFPPPGWQESKDEESEKDDSFTHGTANVMFTLPKRNKRLDIHKLDDFNVNKINSLFSDSSFNNDKEQESGSFSFESNNSTGIIKITKSSIASSPKKNDEDDTSDSIIFADSANCNNKNNSAMSASGDSFIVFQDSGCADKSERNCNNNNNNNNNSSENSIIRQQPFRPQSIGVSSSFSFFSAKVYLYIQMQLCRKESLRDWLKTSCDSRDKNDVLDIFDQIVSAVEYVHSQGLMHRDLKPSNIFFAMDGSVKVGDFGLVTAMAEGIEIESPMGTSFEKFPTNHTGNVGTQLYMSPEQIMRLPYSQKVDVFSLGIIFFEMSMPFFTEMERIQILTDARRCIFPPAFITENPTEHKLLTRLLSSNPDKRPCTCEIRCDPILKDFQPSPEMLLRHRRRSRTVSRTYSSSSSGSGGLEMN